MTRTKYLAVEVKKSPTDGSGKFTAVVSTFEGEPDADGDVIAHGAYDNTISEWKSRKTWPTVWYMHGYDDPLNAVGKLTDVRIEGDELVVDGQLDLNNERAVIVYEAMLTGKLNEFSIGYAIREEELIHDAKGSPQYYLIKDLELLEISIVFAGANRHTRLVSIKAIKELMDSGELDRARAQAGEPSVLSRRLEILDIDMPVSVLSAVEKSIQAEAEQKDDELRKQLTDIGIRLPRKNSQVLVPGSQEERAARVHEAVQTWATASYPKSPDSWGPYVVVSATFDDHMVVAVEDPTDETKYLTVPYTVDSDGKVALGEPAPASVEVTVEETVDTTKDEVVETKSDEVTTEEATSRDELFGRVQEALEDLRKSFAADEETVTEEKEIKVVEPEVDPEREKDEALLKQLRELGAV